MATRTDDAPKGKLNKQGLQDLLRFYRYFRPYRLHFSGALLLLLASGTLTMLFPAVIRDLLDHALAAAEQGDSSPVRQIAYLLGGGVLLLGPVSFLRVYLFYYVGEKAMAALRQDLYGHLIRLPMSFYGKSRVGELSSRIGSDISLIQDTFVGTLAELIRGILVFCLGLGFILYTSVELSLVMLGTIPLVVVAAAVFGRYIRRLSKDRQDHLAESNTVVEETLQGIQSVKSYANEAYERQRYGTAMHRLLAVALKSIRYRSGFVGFIIMALFGSVIGILIYGADMVARQELTAGELVSFIMYTFFVAGSMGSFGQEFTQLQRAIGATERVRAILAEAPELPEGAPDAALIRLNGAVRFEAVDFAYPGAEAVPVLRQVSFRAEAGQAIALVGPSGAGKSTVVALLQQFYQPQAGLLYFDDKPAEYYGPHSLRRQMALVPQDVFLFGGSIRENIAYGKLDASQAEIETAARQANAHDFICGFPNGYDTLVGERGLKLSGGQRQRIAIARAVLRDPRILILDEATSALDSESERLVQEAIGRLMQGRTTFIVAHRLSTIRRADAILVLQKGQIVEQGTHDTLIRQPDGLYASLARLQFDPDRIANA
ncbi:MAG: ABC transporter ATP-binding protein [Sphingobacteriia bacterium]